MVPSSKWSGYEIFNLTILGSNPIGTTNMCPSSKRLGNVPLKHKMLSSTLAGHTRARKGFDGAVKN